MGGEALAAAHQPDACLRAFDDASSLLPHHPEREPGTPYLALDESHLARWRGNALARSGYPDAITVLTDALDRHDTDFGRAEASLRTDLAIAHLAAGQPEAAHQQALAIAEAVGSTRQLQLTGLPATTPA